MLNRRLLSALLVVFCLNVFFAPITFAGQLEKKLTADEAREVSDIARRFTAELLNTRDLEPLIGEFYLADFDERYREFGAAAVHPDSRNASPLPGLEYPPSLIALANAEDWRRFHIASNTFLVLGFTSSFKRMMKLAADDSADFKDTDMFPAEVIELFAREPLMSNFIMRKGPANPITTADQLRTVVQTLEKACTIMRRSRPSSMTAKDRTRILDLIGTDATFSPGIEISDVPFFGFPVGTRIIGINTPLMFRLILVNQSGKWKIVRTEPFGD